MLTCRPKMKEFSEYSFRANFEV